MRKGEAYIACYAAGLCLIGSLLLAGTAAGLKERQDAEAELDRKRNVLRAFQVPMTDPATRKAIPRAEVERIYAAHVREAVLDPARGEIEDGRALSDVSADALARRERLPLYRWEVDGQITRIAIPVSGKGLWSTIYGFMALDATADTILGVSFYRHGETPGLGAEIEQDAFTGGFRDRTLVENGAVRRIEVARGKAPAGDTPGRIVVDGVSGATLTGNGVMKFLNEDLARYEPYFATLRRS
jgi:Na+-transporting NADH:ubiquinone oxidoreductase subunit C